MGTGLNDETYVTMDVYRNGINVVILDFYLYNLSQKLFKNKIIKSMKFHNVVFNFN